jgi:hypothetical protein
MTDELKFKLFGQNRSFFVQRKVTERMRLGCIVQTVQHGWASKVLFGGILVEKNQDT